MLTPQTAANWQTAYNVSYYVLLAALLVSFVATGLTFISNNRLSENLTERLTETTRVAGEANERAANLEKEAAEARLEQEKLKTSNLELQRELHNRLGPNPVPDEVMQAFASMAASSQPFSFTILPISDPSAYAYARQLLTAFEGTPVSVKLVQGESYMPFPHGLMVYDIEDGPLTKFIRRLKSDVQVMGYLKENPGVPTLMVGAPMSPL